MNLLIKQIIISKENINRTKREEDELLTNENKNYNNNQEYEMKEKRRRCTNKNHKEAYNINKNINWKFYNENDEKANRRRWEEDEYKWYEKLGKYIFARSIIVIDKQSIHTEEDEIFVKNTNTLP